MKNEKSLFADSSKPSCLTYQRVLNAEDERCRMVKARCEDLWIDYWKFADENFLDGFRVNFHQRWFEMYLTVSLIRAGLTVESTNSGPDVFATIGERRVWVEAVCATEGQEGKPDSVPPLEFDKAREAPTAQCVMRIRNALEEKARKYEKYLEEGIVDQDDVLVVAISVGQILMLCPDLSEYMKRSLYGIGDIVLTLNRSTRGVVGSNRQHVEKIKKASGAEIGVQPFVDGSMHHVSAVLTSCANALSPLPTLGGDFVLYPNLSCRNLWIRNMLPVAEEWSFEEVEDGWVGEEISGKLSS